MGFRATVIFNSFQSTKCSFIRCHRDRRCQHKSVRLVHEWKNCTLSNGQLNYVIQSARSYFLLMSADGDVHFCSQCVTLWSLLRKHIHQLQHRFLWRHGHGWLQQLKRLSVCHTLLAVVVQLTGQGIQHSSSKFCYIEVRDRKDSHCLRMFVMSSWGVSWSVMPSMPYLSLAKLIDAMTCRSSPASSSRTRRIVLTVPRSKVIASMTFK